MWEIFPATAEPRQDSGKTRNKNYSSLTLLIIPKKEKPCLVRDFTACFQEDTYRAARLISRSLCKNSSSETSLRCWSRSIIASSICFTLMMSFFIFAHRLFQIQKLLRRENICSNQLAEQDLLFSQYFSQETGAYETS